MNIGEKIKRLRVQHGLTQEELAARTELSKGFISQVERDLTSPSIATLVDLLESLGTTLKDFFNESNPEKTVFGKSDVFIKTEAEKGFSIHWLIPNAQKNQMEPILLNLLPEAISPVGQPHEGEEFGYVLKGTIQLVLGSVPYKVRAGESFCFKPTCPHYVANIGTSQAKILWVATPPSF